MPCTTALRRSLRVASEGTCLDVTFDGPLSIPPSTATAGEVAVAAAADSNCAETTACATSLHPQLAVAAPPLLQEAENSVAASLAKMARGSNIDDQVSFSAGGRKVTPTDKERWEHLREQIQALHTNVQSIVQQRQNPYAAHPALSSQLTDGCKSGSAAIVESSMAQLAKRCLNKQASVHLQHSSKNDDPTATNGLFAASSRRSFSVGPITSSGEALGAAPWLATSRQLARTSPRSFIGTEATPCGSGRSSSRLRGLHG